VMAQAEDRCHRIGQAESVLIEHLVLEGSLDARMEQTAIDKQDVADQALDTPLPPQMELPAAVPYEREPVKAVPQESKKVSMPPAAAEETLTTEEISVIHQQLRYLAGLDSDRAAERNDVGFSRYDGEIGHSLAAQPFLSVRQALLGRRILKKYRRQLENFTGGKAA